MPQTTPSNTDHALSGDLAHEAPRVYPIDSFLKIQGLMQKLNLTPADCLQLQAEMLEDLHRQIADYEATSDGLPFP